MTKCAVFVAIGLILLAGCTDPERQAREQYMGLCQDYRQSCECQYDALREKFSDAELVELIEHLRSLAAVGSETGAVPRTMTEMPGSPAVRQGYFNAVLACTRF